MLFLTSITGNYESEPPFHKKLIGLVPFNLSDRIKANTCMRKNKKRGILEANLKVAKFFAKKISHLIGFRIQKTEKNRMLMYNREKVARTKDYKKEEWFSKRN